MLHPHQADLSPASHRCQFRPIPAVANLTKAIQAAEMNLSFAQLARPGNALTAIQKHEPREGPSVMLQAQ